ncbi:MAG: hypothetical protein EZS28_006161 [Streblomastix strix]|uniref:DDE-1 domain-containing protein n=1 Tax=Streblomastix strix TaxID=222440 RepID=A0A5J4WTF9_9EUKA|nr:MAG: hypothetical protein EZS28_006161 [Streblomastix strix]
MNLKLLELSGAYVSLRNQTSIGFAKTATKEETRLKISQYSVETYDETIHKFLECSLADLVYCTDEVGYSGLCNKRNRSIIVQVVNKNKKLNVPVERGEKRVSSKEMVSLNQSCK